MSTARALAACLPIIAGLLPGRAAAHPSGVSKVDMIVRGDTVEARVDVNRDDLFYALGFKTLGETPKSEYASLADRIAYYYQTRLDLKFDGRAADMKILQYKKHGTDLAAKLDSADLADTTIAFRMGWAVPPGTKRLELGSKLFAELEVQPLCHLRIDYQGTEIKRKFVGLDDRFSMSLQPDSLEAYLAAANRPAAAPGAPAPADEESVVGRFIRLGFTHILPEGTDHILFVLGLFFFSTLLRPLLIQVTAFTIAHSITLGLSLLGVFSLPSRIVEPLIALSIVVVAVENIFFRKLRPSRFLIVFAFGLIHGLGFAGVLKSLGLPEGQFFKVLVSFNVGVELGQLTVIAAASALTVWMWKKPWYYRRVVIPVSSLIAAVGLFWFIQRILIVSG
ncbi:MAG TPA: HupE/UreJ family protein [Fibrobacteria bacterium]|nr:HupE/UreJ family protein [Fibrobacteria bacterium]